MAMYTSKPQWDGTGAITTPVTTWDKGYGVVGPMTKGPDRRSGVYAQANGELNNGLYSWPIFITDISIDLSVSGSIAQSQLTRDFYPHNFVQPSFSISGQAIDEEDYGMMCDFVHMCQREMLSDFSSSSTVAANLMQLQVAQRGIPGNLFTDPAALNQVAQILGTNAPLVRAARSVSKHYTPPVGVQVQDTQGNTTQTLYNASTRGPHKGMLAQGFVGSMPRQHANNIPAPTWSFQFNVVAMLKGGPYTEQSAAAPPNQVVTWVQLLQAQGASNISTNSALQKQAATNIKWAAKNSANIISSG